MKSRKTDVSNDAWLADSGNTKESMVRLGLVSTIVEMARQGSLRWLSYVVRKGDDDVLNRRESLRWKAVDERERPRFSWKSMIGNLFCGLGLGLEDFYDRWK